jgi:hypothetical protein
MVKFNLIDGKIVIKTISTEIRTHINTPYINSYIRIHEL